VFPIEAINTDQAELRRIVRRWFTLALPRIRTKEFWATWTAFQDAWGDVRFVKEGFHTRVDMIANQDTFEVGNRISYQDRVARVFRAASHVAGGTAFFLDYRRLSAMAQVGLRAAYGHAETLCSIGLLALIDRGLPGTRHRIATTWRWDGEPFEDFATKDLNGL
jgi:hypothetical protein